MIRKQVAIGVLSILVFTGVSLGKFALAEPSNVELEFIVENAKEDIRKQKEIINSLRKRYEDILKRKKEIQQFIDEENKRVTEKAQHPSQEEIVRRRLAQEQVFRQQEKALVSVIKPKEDAVKQQAELEQKKKEEAWIAAQKKAREEELDKRKRKQAKFLSEQKAKEQESKEEKKRKEIDRKKEQIQQKDKDKQLQELARKKQKEEAWAREKQEQEQLLAQQKEQLLIAERERQMKLDKEADKKAKDKKYVSDLQALLERQNSLLEESNNLELEISQEQENLKALEKNREAVLQKLLEKPSE